MYAKRSRWEDLIHKMLCIICGLPRWDKAQAPYLSSSAMYPKAAALSATISVSLSFSGEKSSKNPGPASNMPPGSRVRGAWPSKSWTASITRFGFSEKKTQQKEIGFRFMNHGPKHKIRPKSYGWLETHACTTKYSQIFKICQQTCILIGCGPR